jgi:hypothetical protein
LLCARKRAAKRGMGLAGDAITGLRYGARMLRKNPGFAAVRSRRPGAPAGHASYRELFRYAGRIRVPGRTFSAGEDLPGHDHVAVLAHGLWQRRFASEARAIRKTVDLDGEKYVVIGVMPASFRHREFLPHGRKPTVSYWEEKERV